MNYNIPRLLALLTLLLPQQLAADPIHDAAKTGDTAVLTAIIASGVDVNLSNGIATPLYLAVDNDRLEAVRLLLDKGADANLPAKWGFPLMVATGSTPEILKLLIEYGADPSMVWRGGFTAQHRAAEKGTLEHVRLLVEAGADVNALTPQRIPPIHLAKLAGHDDVADYLALHGAIGPSVTLDRAQLEKADAEKGKVTFDKNCVGCHKPSPGPPTSAYDGSFAPYLWNVVGRPKGSVSDFKYSRAMMDTGGTWSLEELNAFLSDPARVIPGTAMPFIGIQDDAERMDLIAYLATLSDEPMALKAK